MAASRLASMGQRKRRSRTTTSMTRLPMSAGAMPRRVVSTSGSSGMAQPPARGNSRGLLDLRFFVRDVLARHGVEFFGFHLVRMQPLVLRGRIEMPGTGG